MRSAFSATRKQSAHPILLPYSHWGSSPVVEDCALVEHSGQQQEHCCGEGHHPGTLTRGGVLSVVRLLECHPADCFSCTHAAVPRIVSETLRGLQQGSIQDKVKNENQK